MSKGCKLVSNLFLACVLFDLTLRPPAFSFAEDVLVVFLAIVEDAQGI